MRLHRPLMVTAVGMFIFAVISGVGLILDDRTLVGAPIWLKPLKFGISLCIYTVTLAWLISLVTRGRRAARRLGNVIAVAASIEMAVIAGQAARGRQSHFNFATSLDATLFSIMGVTIVMVWLATLWIGVLLMIQRISDRPTALAIRSGIIIALGGLAVGFLMTGPTPDQIAQMQTAPPAIIGAHSVGVPDGGAGLPIVGWSAEGGDLRAGHFVGMHALQALPLLAFLLARASRRFARLRDELLRTRLVLIFAGVHAALTVLVTWQALRGQPLSRPDALTASAAAVIALVAAGAVAVALALLRPAPVTTAVTA